MNNFKPDSLADLSNVSLPFDIHEVREECHDCIRKQLKKYEKHKGADGRNMAGKFVVPCTGIPKKPLDDEFLAMLPNQEARDEAEELTDIVKWARANLKLSDGSPWEARWYQSRVLRCSSRRKVLRISRRAGKCISEESQILTENGLISAKEYYSLSSKPKIACFDQNTCETKFSFAYISDNGVREVFKLKTQNGRETEVTDNHPFLVKTSENEAVWKELKDISIGDKIAVPSSYSHLVFKGKEVGARKARLLGYLTGDGGINCNTIVRKNNPGCLAKDKEVPKCILNGTEEDIINFLGAYWDCDGWIFIKPKPDKDRKALKGEIGICSASKKLMLQIKHLLLRLGIDSELAYRNDAWQISFSNENSIIKFYEKITLRAKQSELQDIYELVQDKKSLLNTEEDYFWDTVKEIKNNGFNKTYDLTVPETQTLIADDIISHNTDSVCVEICYYLFTNPNIKIVVAGPQKTHAEEIFNRVREFIRGNPKLANMVTRDVSAPWYEIYLSNGARLRGFAAGAKGKGASVGVRGQDADRLYLEEMDYIDERAITGAVLPILQTTPDTALVGFSTPSGFRTPYYECCEEDPQYIEFHFSYKVLPHWRAVEADRPRYTEENWTHEFLAEWGSSESGVYKPEYINASLMAYDYSSMKRSPGWKYCIGTDWNEKHGTEIVVLGYNPHSGTHQVVETLCVSGSEFTQLSGISRLLELNKKWKPDYIYIDAGNGSTNYELLRKTSFDQRRAGGDSDTARLLDILKKYDAGSSIPTRDSITGQDIKMPAKAFMVNASIRMFEQKKIKISSFDDILEKQLKNYIIKRYTSTKTPVYGLEDEKVGDHRLDALNLAIVAFHLEYSDLHAITYITEVAVAPNPRMLNKENRENVTTEIISNPEERRLEGQTDRNPIFGNIASGKIDSGYQKVKTDRRGWDRDMEQQEELMFLQRRRNRGTVSRNRPFRSNI